MGAWFSFSSGYRKGAFLHCPPPGERLAEYPLLFAQPLQFRPLRQPASRPVRFASPLYRAPSYAIASVVRKCVYKLLRSLYGDAVLRLCRAAMNRGLSWGRASNPAPVLCSCASFACASRETLAGCLPWKPGLCNRIGFTGLQAVKSQPRFGIAAPFS